MSTPDPKKQSIIKAPSRAVAKARSNMASRALASVQIKTNSIGMKLKLIPAGDFVMGSPESEPGRGPYETQHPVRITKPFYMQTTTVTQSQWMAVMGSEPWALEDEVKRGSDYPATGVYQEDAVEFCHKLSELENAPYRLPTEAEWEYACRARSSAAYCFGDDADQLEQYAWFYKNADDVGEGYAYAHRVGQKLPNAFGLYDMHGNVWEWCSGWFEVYPGGPVTDGRGLQGNPCRVARGGGSGFSAGDCRSAYRYDYCPLNGNGDFGFRVSLSSLTANERIEQTTHLETQ